ncbi:MAG: orotate phosphoribosyltransferase [Hyphomicrobiaceae bacterium]
MAQASRDRLVEIIRARSYQQGGDVKLVSGRTTSFYFNMKPTMLDPEGAALIGELVLDAIAGRSVDLVGGLEMGAVPLATAVAVTSHHRGRRLPAFFVRKSAKDHGTQKLIEGLAPGESLEGRRVVILEDVTTTGGSSMKAVDAVREAGGEIEAVVTVVDRCEGATENFAKARLPFIALLTIEDFA